MSEKAASNPSEIAREALKRLALRRIPPTPDNFRTLYHEIAGTAESVPFPTKALKNILAALPKKTPEQQRYFRLFEQATNEASWEEWRVALSELFAKIAEEEPQWAPLIRDLLRRLGTPQRELTPAKKREALDHVLASTGNNATLYARLSSLLKSWSQAAALEEATAPERAGEKVPEGTASAPLLGDWYEIAAELLDALAAMLADDQQRLAEEARSLAAEGREKPAEAAAFLGRLRRLLYRLHYAVEDHHELRGSLLHLLRLVIDNIHELTLDDQWLQGQVQAVVALLDQPLELRRLDEIERRLKDVIVKQSTLKQNLIEAQQRIKTMLASFIDRLADFASSTGDYHDTLERCAQKISEARDIAEITGVLDEVMRQTRAMQHSAQRSHEELVEMREKVAAAEAEIARLREELAHASELVRHDPLTGALNRKGLDEALENELSRLHRHGTPLCLALLDIDNFKKLNDSLGHAAGDAALVHLANIVSQTIRPQDTLARYGGEEFVVLLPNTTLEDAVKVMTRVQRELTKHFFLHDNQKILITFSCGVAEVRPDESAQAALERADGAMYLAKRAGKNRVMAA